MWEDKSSNFKHHTSHHYLPTTNYLLPTIYYLLPTNQPNPAAKTSLGAEASLPDHPVSIYHLRYT